jgi:cell division protein FtsB
VAFPPGSLDLTLLPAMALTLPVPSSPSSASADSPNAPQTPMSPHLVSTLALSPSDQSSAPSTTNSSPGPASSTNPQGKRKPSRRANTAERRATHNAVERQRRETLNGRFLVRIILLTSYLALFSDFFLTTLCSSFKDLAALLPNLSQIRRPSKSAIVNSSIAHIHASRRHRAMASRELRLLKLEADALRRELNEWRDRANLPRVEEPVRSEAFSMVLSGEVEILTSIPGMDEEEEGEGLGDEDDLPIRAMPPSVACSIPEDTEDLSSMGAPTVKPPTNSFPHNFLHQHAGAPHLAHIFPRPVSHGRPIVAQNMSNVSFENPAMASLYDQQTHIPSQQYQMQFNASAPLDTDKSVPWNNQIFAAEQFRQQLPDQHNMFTSPTTSQGPSPNSAAQQFAQQAYYQGPTPQQHPAQHVYGSPVDSEDASSVGSGPGYGGSDRSGSDSAYGSPQDTRASSVSSQPRSYEMPGMLTSNGIPARMSTGGVMWNRSEMDNVVALKPNMASAPIAVGGGSGNRVGISMIM